MLAQIITENGVKKLKPLTADAGAGNPVGTIIPMYKKSSPSGYLYCDGSTFDETKYPLLYAYLGSNVLPDYREFALVGAEENTTDVYNASTNPNGTIHDHDVYTEGQAKDDQLQEHTHNILNPMINAAQPRPVTVGAGSQTIAHTTSLATTSDNARHGTVTRGKRKAVYFYIKATSGLAENQQENVLNDVKDSLGRIDVLSNQVLFTALNTDITVNLNEDIGDGTALHLILGTRINSTSSDVRLCDCPVFVSENQTCYIYTFYEARNNTQVKGLIRPYVAGSKQLVLNFRDGTLYPQDDYVVHAVIKG